MGGFDQGCVLATEARTQTHTEEGLVKTQEEGRYSIHAKEEAFRHNHLCGQFGSPASRTVKWSLSVVWPPQQTITGPFEGWLGLDERNLCK